MDITIDSIKKEQSRMVKEREDYEKLKELSISLSYPLRANAYDYYQAQAVGKSNSGKTIQVFDPTAFRGLDIWGNGMLGYYMPKDSSWFVEQMADKKLRDIKSIKSYLQGVDEQQRYALSRSNFYEQMPFYLKDAGAAGDAFLVIDNDDVNTDALIMNCPHPREFWIARDFWGRILRIHREIPNMTLESMKDEFGEESLSPTQRETFKTSPNQTVKMLWVIWRNKDYKQGEMGTKNMLWQHRYVNCSGGDDGQGKIVRETGTYSLNPIPWSLNRPSHETYGRGLVSQMLIEILTCNLVSKDVLLASQYAVRPTTLISSALKNKLKSLPGQTNFVNSKEMMGLKMGDLVARLFDSSGYPFGSDQHERWKLMVEDRFGVTLFLALNSAEKSMTLGEARMKQAEKLILMNPLMASLGTNTDMIFDRIFTLENEAGRMPEPPQELLDAQNGRIDIQYVGPLTQMLKQYYDTGNLLNTIYNIQQVASIFPDSIMVVEGDELMRKILTSGNTPEEIIRDPQAVAELRAIAQEQIDQQARIDGLTKMGGKIIPNMGKKIESDSMLSNLKTEMQNNPEMMQQFLKEAA